MSAHYLYYIRYQPFKADLTKEPTRKNLYTASNQLRRVGPGDTLWIVTMPPRTRRLYLVNRFPVGQICDRHTAAGLLEKGPADLWQAELYALAPPSEAERFKWIDIMDIAAALRFESDTGADRLALIMGGVMAQQLQHMRRLTPKSAYLLQTKWNETSEYAGPHRLD